jgi:hypothetical protein
MLEARLVHPNSVLSVTAAVDPNSVIYGTTLATSVCRTDAVKQAAVCHFGRDRSRRLRFTLSHLRGRLFAKVPAAQQDSIWGIFDFTSERNSNCKSATRTQVTGAAISF